LSFMLTLVTSDEPPFCHAGYGPGGCGFTMDCVYVKDKGHGKEKCWPNDICTQATLHIGKCTLCRNADGQTFCTPTDQWDKFVPSMVECKNARDPQQEQQQQQQGQGPGQQQQQQQRQSQRKHQQRQHRLRKRLPHRHTMVESR